MSNNDDNDERYNIWRIRHTVCELLIDRGYIVSDLDLNQSYDEFKMNYSGSRDQALGFLTHHKSDNNDKIMVFGSDEDKLGVKPIKDYTVRMENVQCYKAILILKAGITPFARRIINEMNYMSSSGTAVPGQQQQRKHIELFDSNELLINITKHIFVPQHIVLTKEQKQELLNKYKLKETQLPRIQQIDPVARYYGLNKGQVVKIIRPSETAGRYVTYRLCV